jgi:hypothetical protein
MLDIDGTLVKEIAVNFDDDRAEMPDTLIGSPAGTPVTGAELYGEKMNLSNYTDFAYPKAAQLIEIHDPQGQFGSMLSDGDAREYRLILEGIVNAALQEHGIAERPLDPRSFNDEYHFIRDYAMTIVCKELELPDIPEPRDIDSYDGISMKTLKIKGVVLAGLSLYGHLPEEEREEQTASLESRLKEMITGKKDAAEERASIIAEAKRKLAGGGAMPIITDAIEGRAYSGEMVEIGSVYAVQKIDEDRGIIHNLSYLKDFSRVINESGIPYRNILRPGNERINRR